MVGRTHEVSTTEAQRRVMRSTFESAIEDTKSPPDLKRLSKIFTEVAIACKERVDAVLVEAFCQNSCPEYQQFLEHKFPLPEGMVSPLDGFFTAKAQGAQEDSAPVDNDYHVPTRSDISAVLDSQHKAHAHELRRLSQTAIERPSIQSSARKVVTAMSFRGQAPGNAGTPKLTRVRGSMRALVQK